jgi:hypothetical protein
LFHFLAFFITGALYFTATAGFFYAALITRFFGFGVSEIVFLDTLEFILTVSLKTEAFVGVLFRMLAILSDFLGVVAVFLGCYFTISVVTAAFFTFTVVFCFMATLLFGIASKSSSSPSVYFLAYLPFFLTTSTLPCTTFSVSVRLRKG